MMFCTLRITISDVVLREPRGDGSKRRIDCVRECVRPCMYVNQVVGALH